MCGYAKTLWRTYNQNKLYNIIEKLLVLDRPTLHILQNGRNTSSTSINTRIPWTSLFAFTFQGLSKVQRIEFIYEYLQSNISSKRIGITQLVNGPVKPRNVEEGKKYGKSNQIHYISLSLLCRERKMYTQKWELNELTNWKPAYMFSLWTRSTLLNE